MQGRSQLATDRRHAGAITTGAAQLFGIGLLDYLLGCGTGTRQDAIFGFTPT